MVRCRISVQKPFVSLRKFAFLYIKWIVLVILIAVGCHIYSRFPYIYEYWTNGDFYEPMPTYIEKDRTGFPKILLPYKPFLLAGNEKKVFMDTLLAFDRILRIEHKKTNLLMYGSQLGMLRHGGFLPFDDDIDVVINKTEYDRLEEILKGTELMVDDYHRDILKKVRLRDPFKNLTISTPGEKWRWPYLDVWHFHEKGDGTFLFADDEKTRRRNDSFPPIFLSFEGHLLQTVKCPGHSAFRTYQQSFLSKCCVSSYAHKTHGAKMKHNKCHHCSYFHEVASYARWRRLNSTHTQFAIRPNPRASKEELRSHPFTSWTTLYMPRCNLKTFHPSGAF